VWLFVVLCLSCRVLWCCGVVLVVSCVVLFSLCVYMCDLYLFTSTPRLKKGVFTVSKGELAVQSPNKAQPLNYARAGTKTNTLSFLVERGFLTRG